MRGKTKAKLWFCTGGILCAGLASQARAQLAVTGNLSTTAVTYESNTPGTGALATLVDVSRSAMHHRHPEIEHREDLGSRAVLAVSAGSQPLPAT